MRRHRLRGHGGGLRATLFFWFVAAIMATLGVAGLVATVANPANPWARSVERTRAVALHQFERVWDDPARRSALARDLAVDGELGVVLVDADGREIERHGGECRGPAIRGDVIRAGARLGAVRACTTERAWRGGGFIAGLLAGIVTLWMIAGVVAHVLSRPFFELRSAAAEMGAGNLARRVNLGRRHRGEVGALADTLNEMASRIEKQLEDQRELLAAVSHEIRTPLARLRVLAELARERNPTQREIEQLDEEVLEIDSLVGQLLATARLDFDAIDRKTLAAKDLGARALERAGLAPALLQDHSNGASVVGDPTLLARALANVLENAKQHGGGVRELEVLASGAEVTFAAVDLGPGFEESLLRTAFERFVRGPGGTGPSLGLGLALVRRIARAHGGDAFAENRAGGGARVGFRVAKSGTAVP